MQVRGLPAGYHLLRAFLLEQDLSAASAGWLCVKSPLAYVEAEFFVESPIMPETRCGAGLRGAMPQNFQFCAVRSKLDLISTHC